MSSITSVLFSVTQWRRVSLSPGDGSLSNVTSSTPVILSTWLVMTVSPALFVQTTQDFKSKLIRIKLGLLSEWITRIGWGRRFLIVIFVNRSYYQMHFLWFRNNDIVYHQNGLKISLLEGNLKHNSTAISCGNDKFGFHVDIHQEWNFENQIFSTSVQSYENMVIFTQHYPTGLQNVSLGNYFIKAHPVYFELSSNILSVETFSNISLALIFNF